MNATRARRAEIGALSRVIEDESDRLCAVIDTTRSFRERELALMELRQLARNVQVCIQALQSSTPGKSELKTAA
jgi:hypothetical protein